MKPFEHVKARSISEASTLLGSERDKAKILAGGTDLLGEMKDYIATPARLVNIKSVPNLNRIEWDGKKGAKLGALVTLSDIVNHKELRKQYPVLIQAIEVAAMPQIRNMATIAGNLCQRPRCWYYRDEHTICLKKGGSTCYAVNGENQYHAILGGGPCHIVHPSDPAPALQALGASVVIHDGKQERTVPLSDFFVLPRENLYRENILKQNEVITHVLIPPPAANTKSAYIKEREKDSYDWALASAAVVVTRDSGGKVTAARVVLGGVAPVPWRAEAAERALIGKTLTDETLVSAAQEALKGAQPMSKNAYKLPLAAAVVKRALAATV
ncbi:MAG: xanthine dehydrogenase family protein subunit M [Armatimonadaceae bacterium]